MNNLYQDCNKFYKLATNYRFASDITDLASFRKKKEQEKGSQQLISLFETMDPEALLSGNINIDSMHEARKKAGFPPPQPGSPLWLIKILTIIDEPNAKNRNAMFKIETTCGGLSGINSKDPDTKKEALENLQAEKELEKENFIKNCKLNKIKFFTIKSWVLDYPLIFSLDHLKDDLIRSATDLLKTKHEINVLEELKECSITKEHNPKNLPIGTTLYTNKTLQDVYSVYSITKLEDNVWETNTGNAGNDVFVTRLLTTSTPFEPTIFTKPIEYFKDKISEFHPDESSIIKVIDNILLHNPEKVFKYSWIDDKLIDEKYDLPYLFELR